jgi:hypothetical protein
MKTSIACVVSDYGNTAFWTVPKISMNLNILIGGAMMFPFVDPLLDHLTHISIGNWHLFYAEYSKRGSMKHLFNCP